MKDQQNQTLCREVPEIEHRYGERVHILSNPVARMMLAQMGGTAMRQPQLNRWLAALYDHLLDAALAGQFPTRRRKFSARMEASHPGASVQGEFFDRSVKVSVAAIARAGTLPAYRCFERLNDLMREDGIRLDHLFMNRRTDATGNVIGVDCKGVKIGGLLDDRILLIPDPMGATGTTMGYALDLYSKEIGGRPLKTVALHLIVTPEYLRTVPRRFPDLEVYALRVDRGMSSKAILDTVPGTHIDEERGLDDRQYIVPGMGGLGELINNSYV